MKLSEYIDTIKMELTGGVLELEISDEIIGKTVNKALKEIQRYIDITKLITVPFAPCIDLKGEWFENEVSAIVNVYRTEGYTGRLRTNDDDKSESDLSDNLVSTIDPMDAQMWMAYSNGGMMYNLNNFVMNYTGYNTLLQMRNTTSTDLAFKEDKIAKKLYINTIDKPVNITLEYIPIFKDVSEIDNEYWEDILQRLSLALVKKILGRIRTRYVQSNALWQQDGDTMLQEGDAEIKEIRETLRANSSLFYPID